MVISCCIANNLKLKGQRALCLSQGSGFLAEPAYTFLSVGRDSVKARITSFMCALGTLRTGWGCWAPLRLSLHLPEGMVLTRSWALSVTAEPSQREGAKSCRPRIPHFSRPHLEVSHYCFCDRLLVKRATNTSLAVLGREGKNSLLP